MEQPGQQSLGLLIQFAVPAGHLLRHLGYGGGKKGSELLVLRRDLLSGILVPPSQALVFFRHPCPSLS